jgi:hypothetical protein
MLWGHESEASASKINLLLPSRHHQQTFLLAAAAGAVVVFDKTRIDGRK